MGLFLFVRVCNEVFFFFLFSAPPWINSTLTQQSGLMRQLHLLLGRRYK